MSIILTTRDEDVAGRTSLTSRYVTLRKQTLNTSIAHSITRKLIQRQIEAERNVACAAVDGHH